MMPAWWTCRDTGVRLSVPTDIAAHNKLCLRLSVAELGMDFYVAGESCWSKKDANGTWQLGCSLSPGLPDGVLDLLAAKGRLDRRLTSRDHESINVSLAWDLSTAPIPATLENYCQGSVCLFTAVPGDIGKQVRVIVKERMEVVVVAKCLWQLRVADGYLLGCQFINDDGFAQLCSCVSSDLIEHV